MLEQIINRLIKQYQTLNCIEISRVALISNYQYLSSLTSGLKIAPVLKSNAYGHGIVQVAQVLDSQKAPFFCVDSLYEAYELYKAGIKTPILIMGYTYPANLEIKELPFSYAIYDLEMAQTLNQYQKGASVHIKIDTGMHRLGVNMKYLQRFLNGLKKLPNIKVEGVMSHLATAKKGDKLYKIQMKNFEKALEIVRKNGFHPTWIHLSASEGLLNNSTQKEIAQISNVVRSGLAIYGISSSKNNNLKPALKFTTKIAQTKVVNKGEQIGYDGIYTAKSDMLLGVLPIGYYDGVDRRLSNKGSVLVSGVKCPIVGKVSMNITTVDLSKVKNPMINQEVIIYSNHLKDPNTIKSAAKICQTIPYDLLVHLAASTKRVVK